MKFIPAPPIYPLIVDSGTRLYCLTGNEKTDIDLQREPFQGKDLYPAIDSEATVYGYMHSADILSFFPLKEMETKRDLINLYNTRRVEGSKPYNPKSLSNKRFSAIVKDIAELLLSQ